MTGPDPHYDGFHREVDRDRPAANPAIAWRVGVGLAILLLLAMGMAA